MKTKLLFSILFLLIANFVIAQSNSINYKAVISNNGEILSNTTVTLRFTVFEGNLAFYMESHETTTDENGIAIVNIGEGKELMATFSNIQWGKRDLFLKTEVDTGSGFKDMGSTEFHAVPYAISGGSVRSINDLTDARTFSKSSIFLGKESGTNCLAFSSVGIGYRSLKNLENGHFNTAVGASSLSNITTGEANVGMGLYSLFNLKTGKNNIAIGTQAGTSTLGNNNIFLGYNAGLNERGSNKLYIESSDSSTPLIGGDFSTNEVIINGTLQVTGGNPALGKVLTSDANGKASWEAVGSGSTTLNDLDDAIYDGSSLFIGEGTGANDDGNNSNAAIGVASIKNNVSGTHNTAIGNYAGFNSQGDNNVIIGYAAGYNIGSGNIIIGNEAYRNWSGTNNILVIDNHSTNKPLLGGNFDTDEIVINGTLKVTGGNPTAGKVLTSDANGKASWKMINTPKQTKTITYNSFNIQPTTSSSGYQRYLGYFIPNVSTDKFYIPINIPIGSKIMSMKVSYYDFSNDTNIGVSIYKNSESTGGISNWGGITTSGYSTSLKNITKTYGYSAHVLENDATYLIQIRSINGSWSGSKSTSISSIELTYEY